MAAYTEAGFGTDEASSDGPPTLGGQLEDAHQQVEKAFAVLAELQEKLSPITRPEERYELKEASTRGMTDEEAKSDPRAPLEKRLDELTIRVRLLQASIQTTTRRITV